MANHTNALGHHIPVGVRHMFVWDEQEIRSTIAQYVVREPGMHDVNVPGDTRQCRVASDTARNTTAALAYWMIRLHNHHFSLDGAFTVLDYCINLSGSLKGIRDLFDRLVPLDAARGATDMRLLANLAQDHVYRTNAYGGVVPSAVQNLLDLLNNFAAGNYLLLKTHPAHEDAMGESILFINLYGLLMSMRHRDPNRFAAVMHRMNQNINSPNWVCDAIQNLFLHRVMCFSKKGGDLVSDIVYFLTSPALFGGGDGESCLRLRRNGESHLCQDYCGAPVSTGTEEGFRAAIAAAIVKRPALVMAGPGPNPHTIQALENTLMAPFLRREAEIIATAIDTELQCYRHSEVEAGAAATAAARYLASQQILYIRNPLLRSFRQGPGQLSQNQQRLQHIHNYNRQQRITRQIAAQAAQAAQAQQQLQQVQVTPLAARNMFNVRDVSNMFNLMEPNLVCTLHQAMFDEGELQSLEWHWESKEIYLPL